MSERIPTGVLVERARDLARTDGEDADMLEQLRVAVIILADRLAELAALEAVGELLAAMEPIGTSLMLDHLSSGHYLAEFQLPDGRTIPAPTGDTPLAALAALAEQVRGRG